MDKLKEKIDYLRYGDIDLFEGMPHHGPESAPKYYNDYLTDAVINKLTNILISLSVDKIMQNPNHFVNIQETSP